MLKSIYWDHFIRHTCITVGVVQKFGKLMHASVNSRV